MRRIGYGGGKVLMALSLSAAVLTMAIRPLQAEVLPPIKVVLKIDGNFEEWEQIKPLAEDSVADISDTEVVNYSRVWAVVVGRNLYVSYRGIKPLRDWESEAFRYNVFIDADNDVKTGYRGWDGIWALGADYLIQGGTLFKFYGRNQRAWVWEAKGMQNYGIKGNQAEMQVPLSVLGAEKGREIKLLFYGDNVNQAEYVPDDYNARALAVKF